MDRLTLWTAILTLGTPAISQTTLSPSVHAKLGPTRDAGTYHVASGTWTRSGGQGANLGADVIYNASPYNGYFGAGPEGLEVVDEGILPSTSNPNFVAPQDAYRIDGFTFGYCSFAGTIDWTFNFYDSYQPCDLPSSPSGCLNVAGTVALSGLPGGGGACWVVTIDLSGGGELCMQADGGPCAPGYDGPATGLDHFGWGATYATDNGGASGIAFAGADPTWSPEGEGTCYLPTISCPVGPTPNGARDMYALDTVGCFNFGGYSNPNGCSGPGQGIFAQFTLIMYTDCTVTCGEPFTTYCDTSSNQLGDLAIDTASVAAGPVLTTSNMTGGQLAYHLIGNGTGVIVDPPGALGELCLAGSSPGIGRYAADVGPVVGGSFSTDLINGVVGGGVGALPAPPGGVLAPGQSWNFQTWTQVVGGSRFSTAIAVTFQ